MIAFACSVASEDRWHRYAEPGIKRVAETDALVVTERSAGSLQVRCNRALDRLATEKELEAVVLLHDDTEITDPAFVEKVRKELADPEVAVIGTVGAPGTSSIGWWDGQPAYGGVSAPLMEATGITAPVRGKGSHQVDCVDGLLIVLSAWAARNLRFDESISDFHGYDTDICFQALAHGRKVKVAELEATHHSRGGIGDMEGWIQADYAFRRKWGRPGRLWRNSDSSTSSKPAPKQFTSAP